MNLASFLLRPVLALALAVSALRAADFVTISDGATPKVAIDFTPAETALVVRLRVEPLRAGFPAPAVRLGIAARQAAWFDSKHARVTAPSAASGGKWLYEFTVPVSAPGVDIADLRFRRAVMVEWGDTTGAPVARQNFFVPSSWPAFRDPGDNFENWAAFSMADHLAARRLREGGIRFPFTQPIDGKASIVIEDADGRRVRNLVSGHPFDAGGHEIEWDGLDENGRLAAPGDYTWRAISHPGVKPEMLMWFYNPGATPWITSPASSWLSDHSNPQAAASNGTHVVLGAPVAESGHNIVLVDLDGKKQAHADMSWFVGRGALQLAIGPDRFFAFSEGSPNYGHTVKGDDGKDYVRGELVLLAWDFSGARKPYDGRQGERAVRAYRKPAAEVTSHHKAFHIGNLRGALWLDKRLYVSLHNENRILILDPDTGKEVGMIEVAAPGPIATDGRAIYGLGEGGRVFRVERPADGAAVEWLFACKLSEPLPLKGEHGEPWDVAAGLAVNQRGELLVADNGVDQNVKVYRLSDGRLRRELGKRGGREARGPWQADAMRMPFGLAVDGRDRLWLAENEPTPRRISVWDTESGRVTREFLGPTSYGAPGAGFDPEDASRWLGGGMVWDVDVAKKSATLKSVLHHQVRPGQMTGPTPGHGGDVPDGLDVQIFHRDGRTFFLTKGRYLRVFELMKDGGARLWAVLGSLESFQATSPRWAVPEVFTRHPALQEELAEFTEATGAYGDLRNASRPSRNAKEYTVLWIDRNGDEIAQVDEIQVSAPGRKVVVPYWSALNQSLDLTLPVQNKTDWFRTTMRMRGFLPSGAPDWSLEQAYADAIPLKNYSPATIQGTLADGNGRLLFNAMPFGAVDADGSLRWSMRNDWPGVHASHRAPLPEEGVMQGPLAFLGLAPFDAEGGITVLNGNHGRFYALTTDGIYLDEFFEDVRVALQYNPMRIGGEPFGGFFGRDPKTGRYLLQSGHRAFMIYEMHGLDRLVRSRGSFTLTADQVTVAQRLVEARSVRQVAPKEMIVRRAPTAIDLDTPPENWPGEWTAEWGDVRRPWPHARAKVLRQNENVFLAFEVKDPSPWLNQGTDRNLLFKSGDAVDFQFSTNPQASVSRNDPVAGDRRLLIANFDGKPTAVLYDFVVPGTRQPVLFASPWRAAKVDRVTTLPNADIRVSKTRAGYIVAARLPLRELGLESAAPGVVLRGDLGVIYSDEAGRANVLRSYWANPSTGLVNDVPGETMINPSLWGTLRFE